MSGALRAAVGGGATATARRRLQVASLNVPRHHAAHSLRTNFIHSFPSTDRLRVSLQPQRRTMSTEAFNETLQFITNVKLQELEKRHASFSEHATTVLAEANAQAGQPTERLAVLVQGMKNWPAGKWSSNVSRRDMRRWLDQARKDPGFPKSILEDWIRRVEAEFEHESSRYDYARLFGNLLTEWLNASQSQSPPATPGDATSTSVTAVSEESFETVNRKETIEQKEKLESLIFEEKAIDVPALEAYFADLFSSKDAQDSLKELRKRIKKFAEGLRRIEITADDVKNTINSVLSTDVLSDEKQGLLKQFMKNPTVVQELSSVLTMQLATLQTWAWPKSGVAVEPRRQLNGKTRFYLDTEILTCLLLHFIGVRWAVEFRTALNELKESRAWKPAPSVLKRADIERREAFLGSADSTRSIDTLRQEYQKDHFFMCQLPTSVISQTDNYADDASADDPGSGPRFDSPVELKQSLLHVLCADVTINKAIHGKCTVVRTDLEWFGPSLPFQTILTILKFFGVPERELSFFKTFLSCPIYFKDDPSSVPRVRQRGVPISYMISTLFGELSMFIMDFGVNQKADGLFLHRLHDDFWLWDAEPNRCVTAWAEMGKYAELAGLSFNAEKTGSIHIGDGAIAEALPAGEIRWGFLRMNDSGKFLIDQAMIDTHIEEMRRQLAATTSVFGWTQAYNKYMAFVVRNCGQPALVYGRAHVDDIIGALARMQKALFISESKDDSASSAISEVAKVLCAKFGMDTAKVPTGWYLWPNAAGGLEIKDPFADLFVMRKGYRRSPERIIEEAFKLERQNYLKSKDLWESSKPAPYSVRYNDRTAAPVKPTDPFFTFEEFSKARTERAAWWLTAYEQLLQRPKRRPINCTPQIDASLKLLGRGLDAFKSPVRFQSATSSQDEEDVLEEDEEDVDYEGGREINFDIGFQGPSGDGANAVKSQNWDNLSPYWQWIIGLHHNEMVNKFGSLAIVDPGSIPVGMVEVFKSSRVRWEL